jgi:hypothetical protein
MDCDNIYSSKLNKNLIVTCLDQRPDFEFRYEKLDYALAFERVIEFHSPSLESINVIKGKYFDDRNVGY